MEINQQYDQRDHVFAREDLITGSAEFEDYYARHPELRVDDDYFRSLPGFGSGIPASDIAMFNSPAWLMRNLGKPDVVDGDPAEKQVVLSAERFTEKIKAYARNIGASLVGISELNQAFVYSHRGRITYPQEPYGSRINLNHRYSISLGFSSNIELVRTGPYPSEMIETGAVYLKSAITAVVLAHYIRSLGYPARAHHFRNYQVLPIPLAVKSGLGELGRCGFLISKKYGNCLRLSTVTTDLPLVTDKPVDIGIQDFCEMCKLCAEVCPSGAIPNGDKINVRGFEKWQIDAVKCITYWNKIGTDCGMCIGACPWSLPNKWWHTVSTEAATRSHLARKLLLWLYPFVFGKYKPKPMPDWMEKKGRL
ncbi:MAG: reductive dehalogenase domain-containing protein [Candidatus Hatepunaea meridiana]|nr:reductive dehalogenase domain-containing protein [Candidatus Hatepunaea meridiana]